MLCIVFSSRSVYVAMLLLLLLLLLEAAIEWLVKLFNAVWERGEAPRDWKSGIIVPIHKKGSRLECTNYRGISLLSVVGKVFARVLNDATSHHHPLLQIPPSLGALDSFYQFSLILPSCIL